MSDYRDPNDPMYGYEPADRTMGWGWIVGAAFLVIMILAVAFGVGHEPTRVASNNATLPQTTAPAAPPTMPGLIPPPHRPTSSSMPWYRKRPIDSTLLRNPPMHDIELK